MSLSDLVGRRLSPKLACQGWCDRGRSQVAPAHPSATKPPGLADRLADGLLHRIVFRQQPESGELLHDQFPHGRLAVRAR